MFPAHPDELKLLKEEMLNKFNLGKRNTFKLRGAPGRKTFSFETWVNKLLAHYISKMHTIVSWLMVEDLRVNYHAALTVRAMGARMARIRKAMMPAPLTPENAKVWLDIIWTLLLRDIPAPEKHPRLRQLVERPSLRRKRMRRDGTVGEKTQAQNMRAAIKAKLGVYLKRMLNDLAVHK